MTPKEIKIIVRLNDPVAALLKVNGLSVLERNLRHLKKLGKPCVFLPETQMSKAMIVQVQGAFERVGFTFKVLEDYPRNESYASLLADRQFSLYFFKRFSEAFASINLQSRSFFMGDDVLAQVYSIWSKTNKLIELDHKDVTNVSLTLKCKHTTKEIQHRLEDVQFAEIFENAEGWIAKGINKKISFPMTRLLVRTPVTPNQITVFCFFLGLLGCLGFLSSSLWVRIGGAALLQFSSIMDGCDGEVARLKVIQSKLGAWLDTISDDVLNNVMLVCLFLGYFYQNPEMWLFHLFLVTLVSSLGVSFFLYHFMISNDDPNAAHFKLAWESDNDNKVVNSDKTLFDYIKPVLKRDFFVFLVLLLTALDLRGVLMAFFVPIWGAFVLYFISFLYGLIKPRHKRYT